MKKRIKHVLPYKKPILTVVGGIFLCCTVLAIVAFSSSHGEKSSDTVGNEKQEMSGKETSLDTESTETIKKEAPDLQKGMSLGADGAQLDYCDGKRLIFHGYFGLFVYDVEKQQMVSAIDLEAIGCEKTQGDSYCEVTVSKDGNEVYLHPMNVSYMYVYSIKEDQLIKTALKMDNVIYTELQDKNELAGSGDGFYSVQKVQFSNEDYTYDGYLYGSDWTIDTLCYVEDDMVFALFPELDENTK